jgi:hypothetical protein
MNIFLTNSDVIIVLMTSDVTGVFINIGSLDKDEKISGKCCKLQRSEKDVDGAWEVVQGDVVELPEERISGDRSETRNHGQDGEHLSDLLGLDAL